MIYQSCEAIKSTLATIRDLLARKYQPHNVFLTGSNTWRAPNEESDIDIFVILNEPHQTQAERIRKDLRALLAYHINLALLVFSEVAFALRSSYPSTLTYQISYKGVKLYEAA